MKAQTYMFRNLNCPNCAAKLEKAVLGLQGVQEVKVSFGAGTMNVQYDEAVLDEQKVKDTIRKFNLDVAATMPGRVK
jgi:Cu+-exporting ATPase